jgi:hypothetical protein
VNRRSETTSFSFLFFSKTLLALNKISIGGVNKGTVAFPFSKYSFFEKMQLRIYFSLFQNSFLEIYQI